MPITDAKSKALDVAPVIRSRRRAAAASDTAGTKVTLRAVSTAVGKNISGMAIPDTRPNSLMASAALRPYICKRVGISTFSQADSSDPVTLLPVSGSAIPIINTSACDEEIEGRLKKRLFYLYIRYDISTKKNENTSSTTIAITAAAAAYSRPRGTKLAARK